MDKSPNEHNTSSQNPYGQDLFHKLALVIFICSNLLQIHCQDNLLVQQKPTRPTQICNILDFVLWHFSPKVKLIILPAECKMLTSLIEHY